MHWRHARSFWRVNNEAHYTRAPNRFTRVSIRCTKSAACIYWWKLQWYALTSSRGALSVLWRHACGLYEGYDISYKKKKKCLDGVTRSCHVHALNVWIREVPTRDPGESFDQIWIWKWSNPDHNWSSSGQIKDQITGWRSSGLVWIQIL